MKKLGILVIAMIMACGAFAQEAKKSLTADEKASKLTEKMTTSLALTAEQTETISSINAGIAKKNEGVRSNTSFTEAQKKEYIEGNKAARISMYKNVLTAEQFTKFEAMEKKRSERLVAKSVSTEEEL